MKKNTFPFSRILSILLACGLLTGCGAGVQPSRPDTPTPVEEISDRETSFSDSDAAKKEAEDFTFSSVPYYEDDTGKSIQRDGNFLYIYHFGDLLRYDKTTGSSTLLYETGRYHDVHFCLYGDYIYFLDRTTANSLDGKNTELYRIDKDGKNLTLLKENILNVDYQEEYIPREHYGEGTTYQIDIYDDTIYLLNTVWNKELEDVTGNLYFRILEDGSVKEINQSKTLYGRLPEGFHSCCKNGNLSLPYAMRNYGYLFVEDNSGNFCRLEPESGKSEILISDSYDWQEAYFSCDSILFRGSAEEEEEKVLLLSLGDVSCTPIPDADDSLISYGSSRTNYVPLENGFICYDYDDFYSDSEGINVYQISSEGEITKLLSNFSLQNLPELERENNYAFSPSDIRLGENCLYYSADTGTDRQLRCFSFSENQENATLHTRSCYDTADIPGFITDSTKEEIPIGEYYTYSYGLGTMLLEEKTDADRLINQTLSEAYAEFEASTAQESEEEAKYYNNEYAQDLNNTGSEPYFAHSDFSLSAYCDYLDKDYIAFGLSYYTYFSGAAHGYYYTDYYLFERKTGKRLTLRDLEDRDDDELIHTMQPYVEAAAEWQSPFDNDSFPPSVLLYEGRLSLSEEGYTLYFAPYYLGPYAAGDYIITIPFDAFENEL